jgi:hypothetical protein
MNPIEQQGFKEEVTLDASFVLENGELVTDFFGDNREWYQKLMDGGSMYGRTSLDSQEDFNAEDEHDGAPLEPLRITEGRAKSIALFFKEYPDAKTACIAYIQHEKESMAK